MSAFVSNEGLELVWLLYEKRPLLDRVRGHDDRPAILKRIAELREPGLVPDLLPLLVIDESLAPEVGRTIAALVRAATPVQLAWLDEQIRIWRHGVRWSDAWHTAKPQAVSRAAQAPGLETVAIGLLASHRNGFVRAAALEVLAQRRDGQELPFLCLRANDWVEPVAARASEVLVSRFRPENRQAILSALPFVVRVLGARRRGHAPRVEQALSAVLLSDGGRDALARAPGIPSEVRRTMYALMTGRGTAIPRPVVDAGLGDSDAVIRAGALGVVTADTEFPNRNSIFETLLGDPVPTVRKLALSAFAETLPERLGELFPRVLLDRAPSLRSLARFIAGTHRLGLVPREVYVHALSATLGTRLSAAIEGVGECGTQADADLITPFLGGSSPRMRRAALRAVARLDPPKAVSSAIHALADEASSVRAAAVAILENNARLVDFDLFSRRARSLPDPKVRGSLLHVFLEAPKWDAPAFLLDALADHDQGVSRTASGLLDRWIENFNRRQTPPTAQQVQRIATLLDLVSARVPEDTARMVRFSLKPPL